MDLKEHEILGDQVATHWYYRSKAAAMLAALDSVGGTVALDIGSGSGFFAQQLLEHTSIDRIDCVDTSYDVATDLETNDGKVIRRRRRLSDAATAVDLAVLMDVLEHVEDDHGLLRAAADRVRPGGSLLITVPAFNWLWSRHDEFLEHHRRYSLTDLEQLVTRTGLTIVQANYLFGLVFPAAVAQRLLDRARRGEEAGSQLRVHAPLTNRVLTALSMAEIRFQRFNRLAGLSVCVLAQRS